MPKPKNKKKIFIDKKNAVSFQLVHRSQQVCGGQRQKHFLIFMLKPQDPLAADSEAPQRVLQPVHKVKEEERAHGVFYEDEYNYLQHLKDRTKVEHDWSEADRFILEAEERQKQLKLPSDVFGTLGEEEEVGLLNKAAPVGLDLSLDPEVVAAMDDDFNFEDPDNEFGDDFVMEMMGGAGDEDGDEADDEDDEWEDDSDCMGGRSEDEEDDQCPSLCSWNAEETATAKFTTYSMSSSVMRRNDNLSTLDSKFEEFMTQYDEAEEGALEGEEIEGNLEETSKRMEDLLMENEKEKATRRQQLDREREIQKNSLLERSDEEDEMVEIQVEEKEGEKWDCESVLSTYSTLYNHPKLISEPKLSKIQLSSKTGIPLGVLGRGLTAQALKQLGAEDSDPEDDLMSLKSKISELSVRPQHETLEEKKARKANLKQFRRERRSEKKSNTQAFKSEKMKQEKILLNTKNNLQGVKIC